MTSRDVDAARTAADQLLAVSQAALAAQQYLLTWADIEEGIFRRLVRFVGDRNLSTWDELADAITRLHHINCRKRIYDPSSSPCTCASEHERDQQSLEEALKDAWDQGVASVSAAVSIADKVLREEHKP